MPRGIYVDEPFLSTDLTLSTAEPRRSFQIHPYPELLALGIMLIEIALCTPIEVFRQQDHFNTDGQPHANTDHLAARYIFDNEASSKSRRFDGYKRVQQAIEACLEADKFMPQTNDINALRTAIYRNIVTPLQVQHESWDEDSMRPVDINFPNTESRSATHSNSVHIVNYANPGLPEISSLRLSETSTRLPVARKNTASLTSVTWFDQFDKLDFVLRHKGGVGLDSSSRVRVAILDTGVDQDLRSTLAAYEDFTGSDLGASPGYTAHLTAALRLFLQVCDCAAVYVGRVFERPTAGERTADYMAKAIKHAVNEWEVDLIILPSGFQQTHEEMERAIEQANSENIVVFAAASNYGNLGGIAFPARLYIHEKVMCMFATNPAIRISHRFNPSPSERTKYSFAILGENIMISGPETLSGTSFSAVIAGGVAARILDFARQPDVRSHIRNVGRLKSFAGIKSIFIKMSKGTVVEQYHCIVPWKLLGPRASPNEDDADYRQRMRAYVRETISRELEEL
ncbi:Peptidase S8/S53, subtilisin/kexin/sedolisin [Akanthomyces lecanii RCEF 1005]|uniref:Peptidase S8/S53, subtilisin/kexin/sedolisin n=1 Tax=Akanthomyces lecanii RCEF 1005 TaxID=1081108 RepID=A0A168DQ74_CORDF|nr:Peptidase S8/S53, subtilisin/kexin/sedolisin [Akanthomyces lecanii RCEF 1005]